MPQLTNIRFQKLDKYSCPVFIASNKREDEKENYEILADLAQKLSEKQYDTYLPIFKSVEHNFCSIRFKKTDRQTKLVQRATYDINYKIRIATRDGKIYANCFVDKLKMNQQPPIEDLGEELEL